MEVSMKENGKMENKMVKGHSLGLMEISMKENIRMVYQMVKGQKLYLMDKNL